MAKFLQKFCVMLWKNVIVRKHHMRMTIAEIAAPFLLFLIIVYINTKFKNQSMIEEEDHRSPVSEEQMLHRLQDVTLLYAPTNSFTTQLIDSVVSKIGNKYLRVIRCSNGAQVENAYLSLQNRRLGTGLGIIFEGESSIGVRSKSLTYTIRSSESPSTEDFISSPKDNSDDSPYDKFLALQMALDKSYIESFNMGTEIPNVSLQPLLAIRMNMKQKVLIVFLSFSIMISYICMCISILKRIGEEKRAGVKELMKLMGLKAWMLWFSWFANALILSAISATVIVLLLNMQTDKSTPPVLFADAVLLWVFLVLYCTASIFMIFAISAFVKRPNVAMTVGLVIWLGSYGLSTFFTQQRNKYNLGIKLLTCLIPNICMSWGVLIIVQKETNGGIDWDQLFTPLEGRSVDISMMHVWIMFLIDVLVYGIITLYIEAIRPGDYGRAKPWYFLCDLTYWRHKPRLEDMPQNNDNRNNYERTPNNMVAGIKIVGLHKEFLSHCGRVKKVAVKDVTLDIYKDHITALLGHNGAGKSTIMMMLTGMFSPTSGNVTINGYSIHNNMSKIRESLGLCPQENMLFKDLTVTEHFVFFGMLKGSSMGDAKSEGEELITTMDLTECKDKIPEELSGGMKRKLCLGIALTGNSNVVILDEPTAGVDPESRRRIWDLLLQMRGQRTILITTHLMEEADVLGDYIAIMTNGQVQCYGTSMYLKKMYGTGYQLSVLKEASQSGEAITKTIKTQMPNATVKSQMKTMITYNLPKENAPKLPSLFTTLENAKASLRITGMGISVTTLEEVFLRVGFIAMQEENKLEVEKQDTAKAMQRLEGRVTGLRLFMQQMKALFQKNVLFTYRNWTIYFIQVVIQVGLMILIATYDWTKPSSTASDSLDLTLDKYGPTKVLYSVETGVSEELIRLYESEVEAAGSILKKIRHSSDIIPAFFRRDLGIRSQLRVAAKFKSSKDVIALYYEAAIHSSPISLNLINNALLKLIMKSSDYSITTITHPFSEEVVNHDSVEIMGVLMWHVIPPVFLSVWIAMFLIWPLTERVSACKQLQIMAGVRPELYWITIYLWYILLYLVVVILLVATVAVGDTHLIFSGSKELGVLSLILIAFGFSGISFAFIISYWSNTVGGGLMIIILMLAAGLALLPVEYLLRLMKYTTTAYYIQSLCLITPIYALIKSFSGFSILVYKNNHCKFRWEDIKNGLCISKPHHSCCSCKDDYCAELRQPYIVSQATQDYGIKIPLLYMAYTSIIFLVIVILADYGMLDPIIKMFSSVTIAGGNDRARREPLDNDVKNEQKRVKEAFKHGHTSNARSDLLLVSDLKKKFASNATAVQGISFGVVRGECFGLLGTNGAGKTTIFRMLTGDLIPTSGSASVEEYSLTSNRKMYLKQIGYCPQFDPLIECFTSREMLKLFSYLRGVPKTEINSEVEKWITLLGLTEFKNIKCGTYSGGNKRKLSTAMAFVGSPSLVFLDEPTSGVDPVARRSMWNAMEMVQTLGQSIVLSSHSMDECEILCNRLVIMVDGQFKCLGSANQLKHKFAQGFSIRIQLTPQKLTETDVQELKEAMERTFACELKDEHQVLLLYQVTDVKTSWSFMFTSMELIKKKYECVEDYSINETTLEQVFMSFANTDS